MSWIEEFFTKGLAEIMNGVNKIYLLAERIDSIKFDEYSWIYNFFGLIRYILGDPLFIAIALFFEIAIGFVIYKIVMRLLNAITSLFPKLKGKFIIP